MKRSRRRPAGFTLVELLVVITIIGILIALLLPAVQAAREAARRMQCQNHLKQLALGVHNYHSTHKIFPPASNWPAGSNMDAAGNGNIGPNWATLILPYIEQQPLYDAFDLTLPISDPANARARGTELNVMLCPTDLNNASPFNGSSDSSVSHFNDGWARGNYGANAGLGMLSRSAHCGDIDGHGCSGKEENWSYWKVQGVMGADISCTIADIKDGTSNTIMLAEIRAGVNEIDLRGAWALGGAGPSAVAAHGFFGDARGPNCGQTHADDTAGCAAVETSVGGPANLGAMGMGCYPGTASSPNRQSCPRSLHNGGVFVALADGSVRWIGDFVEVVNPAGGMSVWDLVNLSADRKPIDPSKLP